MTATVTTITPSADVCADALPITEGPTTTFDPHPLGSAATMSVRVGADRLGFHRETVTHAGDVTRRDYVTIAPLDTATGNPIVLVRLIDTFAERVLDVLQLAIVDGLAGDVELTVFPFVAGQWAISRAVYTDAEGVVRG